jgi:hypothetical protein
VDGWTVPGLIDCYVPPGIAFRYRGMTTIIALVWIRGFIRGESDKVLKIGYARATEPHGSLERLDAAPPRRPVVPEGARRSWRFAGWRRSKFLDEGTTS